MNVVLKSKVPQDLSALSRDLDTARRVQDFDQGAYGHCISLPGDSELPSRFRDHHNNVPFSGTLDQCPTFRQAFDAFSAEVASFRLLRRTPRTAYGLHDDRDKGSDIVRLQIPILTNEHSFIVLLKEGEELASLARILTQFQESKEQVPFDFDRFFVTFGDRFDLFEFSPGYLYYFDTDQVHTAINAGDQERIVLGIDLVRNDWLDQWLSEQLTVPVAPIARTSLSSEAHWNWTSLQHGLLSHPRIEIA
jgi:hypothetical protein